MHALVGGLVQKLHRLQYFYSGNALDGRMDLCLMCYPRGFSEEGSNGGSCADAALSVPAFCGGVVHPCGDVLEWRHAWGEQVQVDSVRC